MAIIKEDARIRIKRSTIASEVPTIPASNDHTDGSWIPTDIYEGEAFLNVADQRMWIRHASGLVEITIPQGLNPIGGANEILTVDPTGTILTYRALTSGTTGTDFNIDLSAGIVLNLPIADATNTGKLLNTDWTTFNNKQSTSEKGVAGGYASLDGGGKVPASELPSYVDDVEEYANLASFPVTGETGKLYVAIDTTQVYRWTGAVYIAIASATTYASTAEINTGTVANKSIAPDQLNGSKYLDQRGNKIYTTATGTDNYSASFTPVITVYDPSLILSIVFTNANTGSSSLSVGGGSFDLLVNAAGGLLVAGDILAGSRHLVARLGSEWRILSPLGASATIARGEAQMQGNAVATVIGGISTPVKVLGTTTPFNLVNFTHTNNRLTYSGTPSIVAKVVIPLTFQPAANNQVYQFMIARSGVVVGRTRLELKSGNSADPVTMSLSAEIGFATGNYIELWVQNDTAANNVTVTRMNMSI